MTSFKCTGSRILVEPIYDNTKRIGTIIVPDRHSEDRPQEATIVNIGPKAKIDALVGDRVITDAFAGTWIEIGGRKHRLLEPADILAKIDQPA